MQKRSLKSEVKEWRKIGLPLHKMEVTKNGKIEGKNEWDKVICSLAPWYPNVVIVKVSEQNLVDMGQLYM
jgi:hypothetical protein